MTVRQEPGRTGLFELIQVSPALRAALLILPVVLVMGALLAGPLIGMATLSLAGEANGANPARWTLANYAEALGNPLYRRLILRSLAIAGLVALLSVLLAYPVACYVAFTPRARRLFWIIAITVPFWTSYLLRVFAWKVILGDSGVINTALISLGLIGHPLDALLYSPLSVVITLTHAWLPFAFLPIYASLSAIDPSLLEAASDLGDRPFDRFRRIILPLSLPGTMAAAGTIFIPTFGDYVTPSLVGGPDGLMVANTISTLFGRADDWPLGSALSLVAIAAVSAVSLILILASRRAMGARAFS